MARFVFVARSAAISSFSPNKKGDWMSLAVRVVAVMLSSLSAAAVLASDRPYLAATTAVVEDDDDRVFELETWIESAYRFGEFRFEPEYNFDPRNAVRVELGIARDRRSDPTVRSRGAEVEFKHLFTDLARSGFGSGVIVAVDWDDRSGAQEESDNGHNWAFGATGLLSLRPTTDTLVHFNLGAEKEEREKVHARWAVAIEHEIVRRTTLFAEAGSVSSEQRLVHGGVRYWVKRERFALDLTVGRRYGNPVDNTFFTFGIALHDIVW
jgi:hypothetical protein